jgi:hypothetical protein
MLVFVLLVGFASAASFTLTPSSLDFNKNDSSQTFTVANTGASVLNISLTSQTIADTNGNTVTIGFNETSLSIAASGSTIINATTSSLSSDFLLGNFSKTYTIQETGNSTNNQTLNLYFLDSFCSSGSVDDTDLKLKVDINNKGEGDNDEWLPLDIIEIEIELENNKNNIDLDNVVFELGLFKENSNTNIIDEMLWISDNDEEVEVGDIDEDEDDKHTFEFRIDPTEVEEDDYWLVVKAYPDGDESDTCVDHSENLEDFGSDDFLAEIQITKENDQEKMVVIDEESYPLIIDAFCDASVTFTADIYNIGDDDFLDQIKVLLVNNELGLNLAEIVSGDLDESEKTEVVFSFDVPSNAEEKQYVLVMEIFYDYDEDDETYDEVSDSTFDVLLKVQGNCGTSSTTTQKAVVSATLESGGKAGQELVVKATITNTGDDTANYILNAAGYSEWASSANVVPGVFSLGSGESREVLVTFNVESDASGEELFDIEVVSGNEVVVKQPVSVLIESQSVGGFITDGVIGDNLYLWGLGLFNVILIVAIVFVVVRLMRK